MKWAIFSLVFLLSGCFPYATEESPVMGKVNPEIKQHQDLDKNGLGSLKQPQGFLERIKMLFQESLKKILVFFGVKDKRPAYCQTILEDNPTAADYIRTWYPDEKAMYCPETDNSLSCQKKYDEAFKKGLFCYEAH